MAPASCGVCVAAKSDALTSDPSCAAAEAAFRRVEADGPGTAANGLGWALYAQGAHNEALQRFDVAITLEPDHVWAHHNRAWTLEALGRHTEAVDAILNGQCCVAPSRSGSPSTCTAFRDLRKLPTSLIGCSSARGLASRGRDRRSGVGRRGRLVGNGDLRRRSRRGCRSFRGRGRSLLSPCRVDA